MLGILCPLFSLVYRLIASDDNSLVLDPKLTCFHQVMIPEMQPFWLVMSHVCEPSSSVYITNVLSQRLCIIKDIYIPHADQSSSSN